MNNYCVTVTFRVAGDLPDDVARSLRGATDWKAGGDPLTLEAYFDKPEIAESFRENVSRERSRAVSAVADVRF